jgi:hypothetical protein
MVKISPTEPKSASPLQHKNLRKSSLSTFENSEGSEDVSFSGTTLKRTNKQSVSDSGAPQALADLLATLTSLLKVPHTANLIIYRLPSSTKYCSGRTQGEHS